MLSTTNNNIHGVKWIVDDAEKAVQIRKYKILSQNPSLQGDLEKYMNCLKTAYKYIWGEVAIDKSIRNPIERVVRLLKTSTRMNVKVDVTLNTCRL
ncbi:unnamed protein product [Trichobilharzia szidati]|nr:unnamed protein product [Trichobilharzia szidati]